MKKLNRKSADRVGCSDLFAVVLEWENQARNAFASASQTKNDQEKRFIEHKAMILFNCSRKLKTLLPPEPHASGTLEELSKSRTKQA